MAWTVTQKQGTNAARRFELSKVLSNVSFFRQEMGCGLFLLCAAVHGRHVGASWVFQIYFATQAHCTHSSGPAPPPSLAAGFICSRALFSSSSRFPWCSSSTRSSVNSIFEPHQT